jgi:hypothetical protein
MRSSPGSRRAGLPAQWLEAGAAHATNSMILHEVFFDGLGDESGPEPA